MSELVQEAGALLTTLPVENSQSRGAEQQFSKFATMQDHAEKQSGPEHSLSFPMQLADQHAHNLATDKTVQTANRILGLHGWSSAIQNIHIDFMDEGLDGKISLGVPVIVRIILSNGTFLEDVGHGHVENCKKKAVAFGKAKKLGVADALSRTLMAFSVVAEDSPASATRE